MSRIISDPQKKEVFKAIPAQVTIGETTVTASKIWSNQKLTSYPSITLNISLDDIPHYVDVVEGVLYYQATLTVHVLAGTTHGIPGVILAEALAGQTVSAIETWIDPLPENVRIFDLEGDISSMRSLGTSVEGITDLVLSVKIYHS
ncbi:hypothetical protein MSHOH_1453 [Methanosarcina horonobensis HB-1 = JCM 15518]|uniref:Uncharacterized protein n=1 Tax=Methanosarcina horonobensis HB-1 = JCM 15518 TaxID=1434110 RepID=A0A0E3SAV7_9EURY|nr:hypothetical protein [Methanosarcina horonobensis]AKB77936.1 hypothetical protein MSHOH_1453 [Methanosarcina horonobensis HB-1 = JCM 15518]